MAAVLGIKVCVCTAVEITGLAIVIGVTMVYLAAGFRAGPIFVSLIVPVSSCRHDRARPQVFYKI